MKFKTELQGAAMFWTATAIAAICLVLVIINSTLVVANASLRGEVSLRQQSINQSIQLSRLNQELVNALAATVLRSNNAAIRDVLAKNNIIVPVSQPAAGTPAESPAPAPANPPLKKP